ncbi:MAG: hypothetical protein ACXWC4_00225 [Telluria sp.]
MSTLPGNTFRGLPLTPEQVKEVEHYIHVCVRTGVPWDTPELARMLDEMLHPPETTSDDTSGLDESFASERAIADNEESNQIDLLKSERDRNH